MCGENATFWRECAAKCPRGFWAWVCGWGATRRAYLVAAAVWAAGCGGTPGMASESATDAGDAGHLALHSAYACSAADPADASACIADFKTGSGSDCVFTCDNGTCVLIRLVDAGFENVATCVAPGTTTQPLTVAHGCYANGTTYALCAGAVDYGVRWKTDAGAIWVCVTGRSGGPSAPCDPGTTCMVNVTDGGQFFGVCR